MYTPYQPTFQLLQQPYAPTVPAMQSPVQVQPQAGITGHLVGSHEEIQPNDVPMNGSPAYFPAQDGSVIYAKQWNPNGSITTVRYVPAVDTPADDAQAPTLFDIMNQLSDIQDILKSERKPATTRKTTAKKGTADDASD